jgi:hypothetical protein
MCGVENIMKSISVFFYKINFMKVCQKLFNQKLANLVKFMREKKESKIFPISLSKNGKTFTPKNHFAKHWAHKINN